MATAIAIIKLLVSIGPALIDFVKKLEELLPETGMGADKLAFLKKYLESVWATLGKVAPVFEDMWPKIEGLVAIIVSWFNKKGLFKTSSTNEANENQLR